MQREFPRHLNALAELYEFTEEIMKAHDLPDGVRFPVHLAMEELFVNMVHYNPTVTTDIGVAIDVADRVTVSLVDNGGAEFDVTTRREVDVDAPLEDRKPGGLGIHLIQNLVDSLEYQYHNGRGEVIFTKGSGNEDV
jgi:anti-sigma regulatory factor (Ser/Thr protein kinase)